MPADRILKLQAGLNGTPIPVGEPAGQGGGGLTEAVKQAILEAFDSVAWMTKDPVSGMIALANALGTVYTPRYRGYITYDQIASRIGFEVLKINAYGTLDYNNSANKAVAILKLSGGVRNLKARRSTLPFNLVFKAEQDGSFYGFQFGGGSIYHYTLAETQDRYVATSTNAAAAGCVVSNFVQPPSKGQYTINMTDTGLTFKAEGTDTPMTIEGANMIGFMVGSGYFGYSCMREAEAY